MADTLFLLDGMALVYRAHFALIRNPIFNSKGQNTSALFGFTNTLLDILTNQKPTHVALAMDTPEPTERHKVYAEYKAQREEIPEDIADALPHIEEVARALGVAVLKYPGYEADDVIGTVARIAAEAGIETFMVTPDKDFAQLVTERTHIYKPARRGNDMEVVGVDEVKEKWNVQEPEQVADVLGLWGDASDNIPGVPGFGEKTAKKLIGEYGTIETLLEHANDLKGKQKERLLEHAEQARLSKQLATIDRAVPVKEELETLRVGVFDEETLGALFTQFEFNSLGQRVLGEGFKAGRGHAVPPQGAQSEMLLASLQTLHDVPHQYGVVTTEAQRNALVEAMAGPEGFCFDVETDGLDPKEARLLGIAFSNKEHEAFYAPLPGDEADASKVLDALRPLLEDVNIEKTGHNLKFDTSVLASHGIRVRGPLFDTMLAHFLVEPERRHSMDQLAEQYLGYTPVPITALLGEKKDEQQSMAEVPLDQLTEYAAEDADVTWRLRGKLKPLLAEKGQEKVFYDIECPLVPVLSAMEGRGVRLNTEALKLFSVELAATIQQLEESIQQKAGCAFNLNSPKQLGEVLFDKLKLVEKARKTKTGQYATNEQVLSDLAPKHEIVREILEYREASKLKSTYVDALPHAVSTRTGRVHTSFIQTGAATGRLASADPNLQNIPIRTELGRQIRKAFVACDDDHLLLSADYSQIELRVMAEMSGDEGLREAFRAGHDIHAATAARVYGLDIGDVDHDMRQTAKMVNFGIIYGISAFGLARRLAIPRTEAAAIIEQYFVEYPRVKEFMDQTIDSCQQNGYVETMTGRRRTIRDINSANGTTRAAAERTAINSPIQGTAADMIKLAMTRIHRELEEGGLQTRMILQVHDELVFDMLSREEEAVRALVEEGMKSAHPMSIPVVVEMGVGSNWLEAH